MPKSTLFFPYKGSVLDPPKNKLQRRVFAMWDFNYSYLVLPKRKITLIFHLFFLSENLIGTFPFFFNFFFMGILLELKLDWTYKVQKHRANPFLFMVEVNIGLKIILKNVL